tara:strand:+ start:42 stop:1523 length:1482 start_codon:yes stop_codon:yes gene_type:complete
MKKIVQNFNNLIKRTIFKVQNKTIDNFNISSFNKYLITFITSLFFYLFYLLIPLLYDKTWVQSEIESKLLNEFKVNISTSAGISYHILPAPHFLINDSKILLAKEEKINSIGEIKNLQVFLSQKNFFDKEKMNIKEVIIDNANFSIFRYDLNLLNRIVNKKFSNKKIKINKSNIFFKDNLKEIISIIKVDKAVLFFDDQKLLNFFSLNGEIFNVPFIFNFNRNHDTSGSKEINFIAKHLRLNIYNRSVTKKKLIYGENNISFLKSTFNTKYNIKEKIINFKSDNSRLDKSQIDYEGELSINPFDLSFNINLDDYKISNLLNTNPILIEFIKSGLLFNDNISVNSIININSNLKKNPFHDAKINFNIVNGKIHFDKTKFVNDDIGSLKINNSDLSYKNNELVFKSDLLVNVKNSKKLFSLLNTGKSSRKEFQTIKINFEYNFLDNKIKFNSLNIDNNDFSSQFLTIINNFNFIDLNNLNKNRRILNAFFEVYAG